MVEENTTTETEAPTPEKEVALHEADDADIDAYLEGKASEASEPKEETPTPEKEQPVTNSPQAETAKQPQPEPQKQITQEEFERIRQENEKLKAQTVQQERYIKHRGTEIGDLRKQLKEAKAKLETGLDERFLESPSAALRDSQALQQIDQNLQALDHEEATLRHVEETHRIVSTHIKPEDANLEDMVQSLRDDGLDERFIQAFAQNPFQAADGPTLIHLAKRAKAEGTLRKLIPIVKNLVEENKQLKAKPERVIQNVQKALKQPPQLSAANGGTMPKAKAVPSSLAEVPYDQLVDLLNN